MEFEKGEYIIYGRNGICKVEDITHLQISGVDRKRLYYVLTPLGSRGSRICFPADREQAGARRLISKAEAEALLDEIRDIPQVWITNEKLREESYRQALNSCDYRQWVAMIKTLYLRKQDRLAQGRKFAATDERYLKMAEEALYGELSFVLDCDRSELERMILDRVGFTESGVTESVR